MKQKILVIHGPNLNLLGSREKDIYGKVSLAQIDQKNASVAKDAGCQLESYQSNNESDIIERVQTAKGNQVDFIIINPAAFTHTSIAIRDALLAVELPFIEIHLSNIFARDEFRKVSYFSDIAEGVITGLGPLGYQCAVHKAVEYFQQH